MPSNPFCCIGVFEALFLHANGVKVECSEKIEKRLLISVSNSKEFQLVKQSFLGSTYFLRIDFFYSCTACSKNSLQIVCSVEKNVTIRAPKRLEDCIIVAYVADVFEVSQQSHRILYSCTLRLAMSPTMFLHPQCLYQTARC